jgi:hypothetical protein
MGFCLNGTYKEFLSYFLNDFDLFFRESFDNLQNALKSYQID